ncbi:MAG: hypothetical protein ACOC9T_00370 [Myxococcota bacterium]
MIPVTFDVLFTKLRTGAWSCRLRARGVEIRTSPSSTPLEAVSQALRRLGEEAGVPAQERPRTGANGDPDHEPVNRGGQHAQEA